MSHVHQRVEMNFFFWFSLHFGQEINHLGSDDLFFWFSLRCTSPWFVVGKKLGNRAMVSNLRNHSLQSQKMAKNGQFCRIISPNAQHRFAPLLIPPTPIAMSSITSPNAGRIQLIGCKPRSFEQGCQIAFSKRFQIGLQKGSK